MSKPALARHLGLGVLIVYGIGDILGAGIYVLVGKVAGAAGADTTLAFIIAGVMAIVTGLSYAELAARIPHSAGACAYCAHAFRQPFIPFLIGVLVLMSGVTSAATAALAFHGYLEVFVALPAWLAAAALIALLALINFIGIRHSARANNVLTAIELAGLLVVIAVGVHAATTVREPEELGAALTPGFDAAAIVAGVTLAFYAFVGFEDLVNLSEEAKEPARDVPRALLIAIVITTIVYLLVVSAVLWSMSPAEAAASERPLLDVLTRAGHSLPGAAFALVAITAICNTALANSIMASRLLYGMSRQSLMPSLLATVHATRHTPVVSILVAALITLLLVLTGGVTVLAQTTGCLLMVVFLFVHLSAMRLRQQGRPLEDRFTAPGFVPYLGALMCAGLLTQFPSAVYGRLGIIIACASALYLALRASGAVNPDRLGAGGVTD
ncbi:MAG: APC family permease [Chromatiales bacterium]